MREKLRATAAETMAIIESGRYRSAGGARPDSHLGPGVFAVLDDRPGAPGRAAFARLAAGR